MGEISHINMDDARYDPEKAFGDPYNLIDHIALTRGQKLAALDRWSLQVGSRISATSEGMPDNGYGERDTALLERILSAREGLRARVVPLAAPSRTLEPV